MKISEVMQKRVIEIKKGTTLKGAIEILVKNKISGAPVIDEEKKLIGIISEKDLFRSLYPDYEEYYINLDLRTSSEKLEDRITDVSEFKVENIMTPEVITVTPDTPIMKVGAIMLVQKVHRIVIVENNKVVGIVSRRDVYSKMFKKILDLNNK